MDKTAWDLLSNSNGERWLEDIINNAALIIDALKEKGFVDRSYRSNFSDVVEALKELEEQKQMPVFDVESNEFIGLKPVDYDYLDLLHRAEAMDREDDPALKQACYSILKYAVSQDISILPDSMNDPLSLANIDRWFNKASDEEIHEITSETVYSYRDRFCLKFNEKGHFLHDEYGNDEAVHKALIDSHEAYEYNVQISIPLKIYAKSLEDSQKYIEDETLMEQLIKVAVDDGIYSYGLSDIELVKEPTLAERLGAASMDLDEYISENETMAILVAEHGGNIYDLDSIVAIERVLGRNIKYEEFEKISATGLFNDSGLFNVEERDKALLEKILNDDLTYELCYRVTGIFTAHAHSKEDADAIVINADFGDLKEVEPEMIDHIEDDVTYRIDGDFKCQVQAGTLEDAQKKAENILKDADFGELDSIERWDFTYEIIKDLDYRLYEDYERE